jgi:methionyl-tRNA formyltransferase
MRVGFAGTPAFAATILAALLDARFEVALVLTQPDRPRGRGLAHEASPVKRLALANGIAVQQPATLRSAAAQQGLQGVPLDVLVVAAYGLILPGAVLGWPRHGGLNVHASLLPRWRGGAPVQRALLAGDRTTGITIMQMDEGLDTGPMIEAMSLPIGPDDTAGSLTEGLAALGAAAIVRVLRRLERDGRSPGQGRFCRARRSRSSPGRRVRGRRAARPVRSWPRPPRASKSPAATTSTRSANCSPQTDAA